MNHATRCSIHPAYEADYCPRCGTATVISTDRTPTPQPYRVSTTAGFELRTANVDSAITAVREQLDRYGYPLADDWFTETADAVRAGLLEVGVPWFYGHVSIEAIDHDRILGHWGGWGCACPTPDTAGAET